MEGGGVNERTGVKGEGRVNILGSTKRNGNDQQEATTGKFLHGPRPVSKAKSSFGRPVGRPVWCSF